MHLSVVAPCFNEQEGLQHFYQRTRNAIEDLPIDAFEILLVDDGSTDHTWSEIQKLHLADARVKGLKLSRNFGHQAALAAGLAAARGELVLIIDADLQDPPELLAQMLARLEQGHDVVYGQRLKRNGENVFKKLSASLFYRYLSVLADVAIPRDTGDFRLINRRVLEAYNSLPERHRFTRGLIAWLGFRQTALPYVREARFLGESKYPLSRMLVFSLDAITGFSLKPLRALFLAGAMMMSAGLLLLMVCAYSYITTDQENAWPLILSAMIVMSALQLIGLGIVGEYAGRTYAESKQRPLFIVEDRLTGDSQVAEQVAFMASAGKQQSPAVLIN